MKKLSHIYQTLTKKRIAKGGLLAFIGSVFGFVLARLPISEAISLSCQISLSDILTMIVSVLLALYVAHVLEKDVHDSQLGKQMYLDRIHQNEEVLLSLEDYVHTKTVILNRVSSLFHRYRSRQTSIHNALKGRVDDSNLMDRIKKLEHDTSKLKRLLTDTPIKDSDKLDVEVIGGVIKYSEVQLRRISSYIANIDNQLFDLRHTVNDLL